MEQYLHVCSMTRAPADSHRRYHTSSDGLRQGQFFVVIPLTYAPRSAPDASVEEYKLYGTPRINCYNSYS